MRTKRSICPSAPKNACGFFWNWFNKETMQLQPDLREFIGLLNSNGVEYVIVGAHALAYHGRPRYTGDLDILVRVSEENARRLEEVLILFGFQSTGLKAKDFLGINRVVQLGVAPVRIDILTALTGVAFDEVWADRCETDLDGVPVNIISKRLLIQNKKSLGRPRDRADLESLEPL